MTLLSSSILCLGKFDALHRGHRALVEAAASQGPVSILHLTGMAEELGQPSLPPLVSDHERRHLMNQWVDSLGQEIALLELPFATVRSMMPDEFTAYMCSEFRVRGFVAGVDFRYGFQRRGTVENLTAFCQKNKLFCAIVPAVECSGRRISSTHIRALVEEGAMGDVGHLLGRAYQCHGIVVRGDGRGRTIGVPTANVADITNMIPGSGVYAGQALTRDGQTLKAAINIGTLPTIEDGRKQTVEAHLIDFSADIYEQPLSLSFIRKLRDEQKFHSLAALKEQIFKDIADVKAESSYA